METYRELLREQYIQKRKKNPGFSMRAFAKHLALTPGALSKILSGAMDLSFTRAIEICGRLGLSEEDTETFLSLLQLEKAKSDPARESILKKLNQTDYGSKILDLSVDAFKIISDWYPMVILQVASVSSMKRTPQAIAKGLGLSITEVQQAIERLARLSLIEFKGKEIARVSKDYVETYSKNDEESIKRYYKELLKKIDEDLDSKSNRTRAIGANALVFDEDQLDKVRKTTLQYFKTLREISEQAQNPQSVYQAFVTVFEISKNPIPNRRKIHGNA